MAKPRDRKTTTAKREISVFGLFYYQEEVFYLLHTISKCNTISVILYQKGDIEYFVNNKVMSVNSNKMSVFIKEILCRYWHASLLV
jgi:hypothetical protein